MTKSRTLGSRTAVGFAEVLADHGDQVAVLTRDGCLSYDELAERVADVARRLGDTRRLVLVTGANSVDPLVTYLAALSAGHTVLLVPGDNPVHVESLVATYDPDVVAGATAHGWALEDRRDGTAHDLHPDLALLLSTSGSTGSPKLVRLSHENLQSNAEAIAEYLAIRSTDRAATTLPMHYCYGLSVINSHLLRGASILLTDLSVVDSCFWDLFREHRGTSFAGVPYTFDLLDRVGFADMDLPHLRYVTQAGGRLAPERVRDYAELGRSRGWDLVVMYGQTEATARMAYLPPDLAASHPSAIGVPIPGGSFSIETVDEDPGRGELLYAGPNVMLGYAETPADLALGRTVDVLRTGDLARRTPDGLYELVGRRSRFTKLFGLRIDLQRAETLLDGYGLTTCCIGTDEELVVAVEGEDDPGLVRRLAASELGLPSGAVRAIRVDRLPRLASGKPDYGAVARLAADDARPANQGIRAAPATLAGDAASLRTLYAELLERPDATEDDTFVGLGGDSLSYVEMSVRLEETLGHLPPGWHVTPIRDLAAAPPRRRRLGRAVETSVLLRALAIVLIVGTHAKIFTVLGSAHVLIAVAGFNFARFQLSEPGGLKRLKGQLTSIARVVVPSVAWIAFALLLTDQYGPANLLLLNAVVGAETWTAAWHFWFVEVLVYILLVLAALLAVPWVDRMERRVPFGFAGTLLAVGLLGRFEIVDLGVPHTKPIFWLFALGWAAARAATPRQKLIVTAGAAASVPGFFDDPWRDAVILGGLVLLVWVPSLRCPTGVSRLAGVLASASLYIYLTHWQVYPHLQDDSRLLAVLASLGVGITYWTLTTRATRPLDAAGRWLHRRFTADGAAARSAMTVTVQRPGRRPEGAHRAAGGAKAFFTLSRRA